MDYENLLIFAAFAAAAWFLFVYFFPRLLLYVFKRAILVKGFGEGPIPINTLSTEPQHPFADPLSSQPRSASNLMTVGVNRDTLLTVGWLDLKHGAQVLRVPDMADRYYNVQFTDPSTNTNFAYVGKRTTGTRAGAYLITGPRWQGTVPAGLARIASPNNAVLVLARVLVRDDADLPTAHALSTQLQLTPLAP